VIDGFWNGKVSTYVFNAFWPQIVTIQSGLKILLKLTQSHQINKQLLEKLAIEKFKESTYN